MVLQKRSRSWYFDRWCERTPFHNGPGTFAEKWECRFDPTQIVVYSFPPLQGISGFCMQAEDTCLAEGWKVNVGWYKEKKTDTDTCNEI
jgi:hypothetical protein